MNTFRFQGIVFLCVLFSDSLYDNSSNYDGNGRIDSVFDGNPYAEASTNNLADIAMRFYEDDLSSLLDNRVPTTCGQDENSAQHLVTYMIGMGVVGSIDTSKPTELPPLYPAHPINGAAAQCTASSTPPAAFSWPAFDPNTPATLIDDMLHASYNGRGQFFSAANAEEVNNALAATIQNISDRLQFVLFKR